MQPNEMQPSEMQGKMKQECGASLFPGFPVCSLMDMTNDWKMERGSRAKMEAEEDASAHNKRCQCL